MSSNPQPWVKFETLSDGAGRFIVSPLERGMGTTLGNSLRRVLLSSLEGYAITSIKIEGVKHEFSTIPHVLEDVFDFICNIKKLIFKSSETKPVKLSLSVSKKGKILASQIVCPEGVEILNQDLYIAELTEAGKFNVELVLRRGKGYAPSEAHQDEDQSIDTISLDASFSPIIRVNHQVENIRVGKELDYDSLSLDVWTNGSISAEAAVRQASQTLVDRLSLFGSMNQKPLVQEISSEKGQSASFEKSMDSVLALTIDDLELSARSSNCLKRAGIETVGELVQKDTSELIKIKNFGKKSADEINAKLKMYGLALSGVPQE